MNTITILLALCLATYSYQKICQGCTLSPEIEEGPYYVGGEAFRTNITEGQIGIPITIQFTVKDLSTCNVMAGAVVDIWHCSGFGVYSYYEASEGVSTSTKYSTFLRGQQITDSNGTVTFTSIYPGWYSGRTNHIHMKIRPTKGGSVIHTGQIFFNETLSLQVAALYPYKTITVTRTTLTTDRVYSTQSGASALSTATMLGSSLSDGVLIQANLIVNTAYNSGIQNSCTAAPSGATNSPSTSNASSSFSTAISFIVVLLLTLFM
jgi:protocatechuate 3,4-dioxygenase beta subunit